MCYMFFIHIHTNKTIGVHTSTCGHASWITVLHLLKRPRALSFTRETVSMNKHMCAK